MRPILRLTEEERRWNDYYDSPTGRRGVLQRQAVGDVTLSTATPRATVAQVTTRRSRVYAITWAGDVYGMKVNISISSGERFTMEPAHIPLLSGHAPHSPLSRLPGLAAYPSATVYAAHAAPQYCLIIEPNIVLPGDTQLLLEYSLEDPADAYIADGGTYRVQHVLHRWEFPGFGGNPS